MKKEKFMECYDPAIIPCPLLMLPEIPDQEYRICLPKKVQVFEYFAIADGCQRVFRDQDQQREYGKQNILDPASVSYMNLFLNGVLQPKTNYIVKKGMIKLITVDAPLRGAPVVLQMIKA